MYNGYNRAGASERSRGSVNEHVGNENRFNWCYWSYRGWVIERDDGWVNGLVGDKSDNCVNMRSRCEVVERTGYGIYRRDGVWTDGNRCCRHVGSGGAVRGCGRCANRLQGCSRAEVPWAGDWTDRLVVVVRPVELPRFVWGRIECDVSCGWWWVTSYLALALLDPLLFCCIRLPSLCLSFTPFVLLLYSPFLLFSLHSFLFVILLLDRRYGIV